MPVQIVFSGESAGQAVSEVFAYLAATQAAMNAVTVQGNKAETAPAANSNEAETAPTEAKKEAAKKGAGKKKDDAKETTAQPKYTLQQAIDKAKSVVGAGESPEELKALEALEKLNTSFGIAKVRELPADKLDAYVEDLHKVFPQLNDDKPAAGKGMFD